MYNKSAVFIPQCDLSYVESLELLELLKFRLSKNTILQEMGAYLNKHKDRDLAWTDALEILRSAQEKMGPIKSPKSAWGEVYNALLLKSKETEELISELDRSIDKKDAFVILAPIASYSNYNYKVSKRIAQYVKFYVDSSKGRILEILFDTELSLSDIERENIFSEIINFVKKSTILELGYLVVLEQVLIKLVKDAPKITYKTKQILSILTAKLFRLLMKVRENVTKDIIMDNGEIFSAVLGIILYDERNVFILSELMKHDLLAIYRTNAQTLHALVLGILEERKKEDLKKLLLSKSPLDIVKSIILTDLQHLPTALSWVGFSVAAAIAFIFKNPFLIGVIIGILFGIWYIARKVFLLSEILKEEILPPKNQS